MFVKICGITNLEDAQAAVESGASALGFNFYRRSPRYIEPEAAAEIVVRLPKGPQYVGVFVNERPEDLRDLMAQTGLDTAQFHGSQQHAPASYPYRVWRAFSVTPAWEPSSLSEHSAEAFLLDAPAGALFGGTGRTFDWSLARVQGVKVILAGGLTPDNVREAIETAQPWGVDACSKLEISPGKKDRARMAAFIRNAQAG